MNTPERDEIIDVDAVDFTAEEVANVAKSMREKRRHAKSFAAELEIASCIAEECCNGNFAKLVKIMKHLAEINDALLK